MVADVLEQIEAMHRLTVDLAPMSLLNAQALGGWSKVAADPGVLP